MILLLSWLMAAPAHAHHVATQYGIAWSEPVSRVEGQVQVAGFDLEGQSGSWQLLAVNGEWAAHERLSFFGRVPVARVAWDDGRRSLGLADVDVGARVGLYAAEHGGLLLSAGLGVGLPTATDAGLGHGHVELSPFVQASSALLDDRLVLHGLVTDLVSLQGHEHEDGHDGQRAALSPHSGHELRLRPGAAWLFDDAYVSAAVQGIVVFDHHAPPGPWTAQGELGVRPVPGMRVGVGLDVPFAGTPRFGWRAGLSVAWTFQQPS